MVSAEQKTIDALKASIALAALVGSGDQLRVFPDEADQSAVKPYIVFDRVGAAPETYLDFAPAPVKVMMLITIWADSRMVAAAVADAVADAMREAFHMLTDRTGSDVPDIREFAEALSFDIWEY